MIICGREISPEIVDRLQNQCAGLSLRELGRRLCHWLDWVGPSGKHQISVAMQVIKALGQVGAVLLPKFAAPPGKWVSGPEEAAPAAHPGQPASALGPRIQCPLEELGPIEIIVVKSRFSQNYRLWRQLLQAHHYLSAGPLCGHQLRYLIRSPKGWLAAAAFSAAARRVAGRDLWIGWTEPARRENLHWIINNSRFLILPHVQVPHVASHLLAQLTGRVALDWQARYGYWPVLVESFVETGRFGGICYQAANWQAIGMSSGRGRQDGQHQKTLPKKVLWVYALSKDFRQRLCELPEKCRLAPLPAKPAPPPPAAPRDWMEEEFGGADLGDERLQSRLRIIAGDFFARPTMNIPQACGSRAKVKAAYRFFDHPQVNLESVLRSHYQASAQRVAQEAVVLAVQDTTELNYSLHPATEQLGPLCDKEGVVGLLLHETMLYNLAGTPLGLIDARCWARDPDEPQKRKKRYELEIEQKESFKWLVSYEAASRLQAQHPHSLVVSVGDREADIYELFVQGHKQPAGAKLLVRARQERCLMAWPELSEEQQEQAQQTKHLWEHVGQLAKAGAVELSIPRRKNQPARQARLEIRFAAVELKPPKRKAHLEPVQVWAICAREVGAPEAIEPVEWLLLTTVPVETLEQAVQKLQWYALRFQIEVYHRTLKSGCKIEERQLGNAERIEACLAIDLVVAWRITHLVKLGREMPDVPCTVFFEEAQWQAMMVFATQQPPPAQPPSLREMARMVAMYLGGFLGRKSDGEPGAETLWRGLQRLDDITEMCCILAQVIWVPWNRREIDTS